MTTDAVTRANLGCSCLFDDDCGEESEFSDLGVDEKPRYKWRPQVTLFFQGRPDNATNNLWRAKFDGILSTLERIDGFGFMVLDKINPEAKYERKSASAL